MSPTHLLAMILVLPLVACGSSAAPPPAAVVLTDPASSHAGVALSKEAREWIDLSVVAHQRFGQTIEVPGRFELAEGAMSEVMTSVSGRVLTVHVRPGDVVAPGDALVTLESPEASAVRAELVQDEAELSAARDALRRAKRMTASGVGLEVEAVAAQTRNIQAAGRVARSRRAVELLGEGEGATVIVRAPIAGTVLSRNVVQGAVVGPDSGPLLRIGDPKNVWLVAQVFERDLSVIVADGAAKIALASGERLEGRIVRVGNVVNSDTRRTAIYIEVTGADAPRAGTFARVAIAGPQRDAIVVPAAAVLIKGRGMNVVYVERDGRLHPREVEVGGRAGDLVEIVHGLEVDEQVVTRGSLLVDNQAAMLL